MLIKQLVLAYSSAESNERKSDGMLKGIVHDICPFIRASERAWDESSRIDQVENRGSVQRYQ